MGETIKLTGKWHMVPPDIQRPQSALAAEREEGLKRERYQSQIAAKYYGFPRKDRLPVQRVAKPEDTADESN